MGDIGKPIVTGIDPEVVEEHGDDTLGCRLGSLPTGPAALNKITWAIKADQEQTAERDP